MYIHTVTVQGFLLLIQSHTITLVGLAMVGGTFQEDCEVTTTTETDVVLGVELACRPINVCLK